MTALFSVHVAVSQTPAYTAIPQGQYIAWCVFTFLLSLVLDYSYPQKDGKAKLSYAVGYMDLVHSPADESPSHPSTNLARRTAALLTETYALPSHTFTYSSLYKL